jgi:hypothetical protein
MRLILFILYLTSISLFSQGPKVFDSLVVSEVKTDWQQFNDYSQSNVKFNKGGVLSKYENEYFYKNGVAGILIDRKNGDISKTFDINFNLVNFPVGRVEGNWDMSRNSTNRLFSFDMDVDYVTTFNITSKYGSLIDTIFSFETEHTSSIMKDPLGNYDFYNIDDKKFVLFYDYLFDEGPVRVPEYISFFINTETGSVFKFNFHNGNLLEPHSSNYSINNKQTILSTTNGNIYKGSYEYNDGSDSHDYYSLENDSVSFLNYFGNAGNLHNWFNVILNDSLSTIMVTDSIKIFNFRNKTVPKSYFLDMDDKVIAKYHFEENNIIALIIKQADGDKRIFAFHYPSYKILLDEIDNAPYLGEMLGELNDGNLLTIGDDDFIYKHKWNYDFNTVMAEFDHKLVDDNKFEFTDLSEGPIKSWKWNFGDGATSTERNPIHQYASSGNYMVLLTATNEYGKVHQASKEIKAKGVLKSNFEFTVSQDGADRIVECTNLSPDIAVRYIWNFGDGTFSNDKNPVHTYNFPGKYYISLTAFDSEGNYKIYLKDEVVEVVE